MVFDFFHFLQLQHEHSIFSLYDLGSKEEYGLNLNLLIRFGEIILRRISVKSIE
jgi:hypothetical protein